MKIHKIGKVIFEADKPVRIEGWNVEREADDPIDATEEQLLLEAAINWAKDRLQSAINSAVLQVFREKARQQGRTAVQQAETDPSKVS